jgi:RNA polymerase sigma-B factor
MTKAPDRSGRDAQWLRLLRRYRSGDGAARERLVVEMLPLVHQLARRYAGRAAHDDLVQVGLLGLTKAVDRFDAGHANSLASYAVPTMLGEMRRYMRDHTWAVRVPRSLQEDALRVTRAMGELETSLGRSPRPQQVADHLGMSLEAVLAALVATRAYRTASLEERIGGDGDNLTLADVLGAEDPELERTEELVMLGRLKVVLNARERDVIALHYTHDLTQAEIGQRIGLSQMQVSRILRAGTEKLGAHARRTRPAAA